MSVNCVYAILADCEPPMVKFGISNNPEGRLSSLQTGSPVLLKLVAHVEAPRSLEGHIHNALRHLRKHGEWFSYEYEAIEIAELIESGNSRMVWDRTWEIIDQLYKDMIESRPDLPDELHWGDRGKAKKDGFILEQIVRNISS